MNPKPENEKTPEIQTPAEEPGKPVRELTEGDLAQVAGGIIAILIGKGSADGSKQDY